MICKNCNKECDFDQDNVDIGIGILQGNYSCNHCGFVILEKDLKGDC